MTTTGENRVRYSSTIEAAPSRFTEPDAYAAWFQRADEWAVSA
ncbi:hypothetical protein [Frondihabitans sp. VKM Ac-2883]|nr:hypothetical protein [Frondihabitans sp. VKM Ac-2883]